MKVVSWNIQQGGGRRLDQICVALKNWNPDIIVLQEVRTSGLSQLTKACCDIGLAHHFLSEAQSARENGIFIAARSPIDAGDFMPDRTGKCHILEAEIDGLTFLPVHFPQKSEQVPLFQALLADSESLLDRDSLIIGDMNCGIPFEDSTHKTFVNARYFGSLKEKGWVDLYRKKHGPDARDFSWISPRTGRGFRYDQALAAPSLASRTGDFRYDHTTRERRVSDHSAIILHFE